MQWGWGHIYRFVEEKHQIHNFTTTELWWNDKVQLTSLQGGIAARTAGVRGGWEGLNSAPSSRTRGEMDSGPRHFARDGLFEALGVDVASGPQGPLQAHQHVLVALPDVDRVLGPHELVGGYQPHVLFHHQVLDDARRCQREAVSTVHQDSLPLLSGRVDALIDVLKAALLQGRPFAHGVRHVSDIHLETGPAVASAAGAGAGYEAEAGARFPRHAAHVDDAVDVVATQRAPVVRRVQVADIDVVRHLGDDGFRVLEVFRAAGSGLVSVGSPGTGRPRGSSPAVVTQLLGAGAGRGIGFGL